MWVVVAFLIVVGGDSMSTVGQRMRWYEFTLYWISFSILPIGVIGSVIWIVSTIVKLVRLVN